MDEISQDPELNIRLARGRWLEVAVAAVLIAVAALALLTSRGRRPACRLPRGQARCGGGPGAAAINRDHADPAAV